jgi:hypothetical protein
MRRSRLWMCALATVATFGCKQVSEQYARVKDQFAKVKQAIEAKIAERRGLRPTPQPAAPVAQTPTPPPVPATPAQTLRARGRPGGDLPERPQAPERPRALRDVPYESPDTGTIAPGMSEREIYSLWGAPIGERHQGEWTFLYYRNGCEYTCGTEDVVFLKKGQVVDAVLRWPGHGYSGQSSSPAATPPHGPTKPGGDTLSVKPSSPSSP